MKVRMGFEKLSACLPLVRSWLSIACIGLVSLTSACVSFPPDDPSQDRTTASTDDNSSDPRSDWGFEGVPIHTGSETAVKAAPSIQPSDPSTVRKGFSNRFWKRKAPVLSPTVKETPPAIATTTQPSINDDMPLVRPVDSSVSAGEEPPSEPSKSGKKWAFWRRDKPDTQETGKALDDIPAPVEPPPIDIPDPEVEESTSPKKGLFQRLWTRDPKKDEAQTPPPEAVVPTSPRETVFNDPDSRPYNARTPFLPPVKEPAVTRTVPVPASKEPARASNGTGPVTSPVIRPGHVLSILVFVSGEKEIEEIDKRVSTSGQLSLPLVGTVEASGFTCAELAKSLRLRYMDFLLDPLVDVMFMVDQSPDAVSPWGYVTLLGRVKQPGRINIPPTQDLGLSMAVQLAGGLDTSAKDTAIRITRVHPTGKTETFEVNLRSAAADGKVKNDLLLESGDVIYVPEKVF